MNLNFLERQDYQRHEASPYQRQLAYEHAVRRARLFPKLVAVIKKEPAPEPIVAISLPAPPPPVVGFRYHPIKIVIGATAEVFGITPADITIRSRKAGIVYHRQVAMYVAVIWSARSMPEIGRRFGGYDHTTVIHARQKISRLLTTSPACAEKVEAILKIVVATKAANTGQNHHGDTN